MGVRPAGEFRIQLTGVDPPLVRRPGVVTLLLGWHQPTDVFAGFDVSRRPQHWGHSPSVQIRDNALRDAQTANFGFYRRQTAGQGEIAVAFSPQAFMDYVQQQAILHEFADDPQDAEVLDEMVEGRPVDLNRIAGHGRREVIRRVMERIGQGNFRSRILAVYRHSCSMCELQLEMVQAAHIIPVPAGGDNSTNNGLALCHLHHAAFDSAAVGVTRDYEVQVNEKAFRRLTRLGRTNGWDEFRDNLREEILLPERNADYPNPDYLERALELRGW